MLTSQSHPEFIERYGMRILALILARGGSKRLPGKNIRQLGDKPMIVWSINAAKGIPEICNILVSTDDSAITTVSAEAGALVPWLRPTELATDTASPIDAALHALDWYEAGFGAVDGLLLLQPTSPFRTNATIRRGIELFSQNDGQAVLGVSHANPHPLWALRIENGNLVPFAQEHGLEIRSQDLPTAYAVNGCFYLISPADLRSRRTFIGAKMTPLLIETPEEALDVDTEWDFRIAEWIARDFRHA